MALSGIPVSIVLSFLGTSAHSVVEVFSGGSFGGADPGEIAVLVIGIVFTVFSIVVGVYYAKRSRREFNDILDNSDKSDENESSDLESAPLPSPQFDDPVELSEISEPY